MNKELESKNIFNIIDNKIRDGYAVHNVGDVLEATEDSVRNAVQRKYDARLGHAAPGDNVCVIVSECSDETLEQVDYLSQVYGVEINVVTTEEAKRSMKKGDLLVPYTRTQDFDALYSDTGVEIWGVNPKVSGVLNNKAEAREIMGQSGAIRFPEYVVIETSELADVGTRFLRDIGDKYDDAGVLPYYSPEIIIQAEKSDGAYGMARVGLYGNKIMVQRDGSEDDATSYSVLNTKEALEDAAIHMDQRMNHEKGNRRIVVSRFVDTCVSPGRNFLIIDGEVFGLGWNSQVQIGEGSASKGIEDFNPDDGYLKAIIERFDTPTQEHFYDLLKIAAEREGIDPNLITGAGNMDLMIPGRRELKYLGYRENELPDFIYQTENNIRLTNTTDGISAAIWSNGHKHTVKGFRDVMREGILTLDEVHVPSEWDGDERSKVRRLRDEVSALDLKLKEDGTRVIFRLNRIPAGLIIVGNKKLALEKLREVGIKIQ